MVHHYINVASSAGPSKQPSFAPEIFQLDAVDVRPAAPPGVDALAERAPSIVFTKEQYEDHKKFCDSEDFPRYRDQVGRNIARLKKFCRNHNMRDAERIAKNFDQFFVNRFEKAYFDTHAHLVDGPGKAALDHLCDMVEDPRFSLDARKAAVRNLAEGVVVCASGTVVNLIEADRQLSLSMGGIRAAIWKIKEGIIRDTLREAVAEQDGGKETFVGDEIHYVSAVWNFIAADVGLHEMPDLMAPNLNLALLEACRQRVLSALRPDRIAGILAEQCMASFSSEMAARREPSSGSLTAAVTDRFDAIMEKINAELCISHRPLRLHGFLRCDDAVTAYEIRTDTSLIAWDLLKIMAAENLLRTTTTNMGDWVDETGGRSFLYTYGTYAWCVQQTGESSDTPGWDANPNPPTVADLFAWSKAQAAAGRPDIPPAAAVASALVQTASQACMRIPAAWIADTDVMLAFLGKLDEEQLQDYLQSNLPYFQNGFPEQDRGALIDRVMGRTAIAVKLARDWYDSPWTLLGEPDSPDGTPRLSRWVMQENVAAIDAVTHMVRQFWLAGEHDGQSQEAVFKALWNGNGIRILDLAMHNSKEAGIDAWHRLLESVISLDRVKAGLLELLHGVSVMGFVPPLMYALGQPGNSGAVKAFHRLLVNPLILPNIQNDLPRIVTCADTPGPGIGKGLNRVILEGVDAAGAYTELLLDPAIFPWMEPVLPELMQSKYQGQLLLDKALGDGNAEGIDAFLAMLTRPEIADKIAHVLPSLMIAGDGNGTPGLLFAMQDGRADAVRAYRRFLTHPLILPHIVHLLPDLVIARTPRGTPALAMAMMKGKANAIKEYHGLLTDPAILPHILGILPELLMAKRSTGDPGLWLAAYHGHARAIEEFHALLADPLILPHIASKLFELIESRNDEGSTALQAAIEEVNPGAASAYYGILADPIIAACLYGKIAELMRLPPPKPEVVSETANGRREPAPQAVDPLQRPHGPVQPAIDPIHEWRGPVAGAVGRFNRGGEPARPAAAAPAGGNPPPVQEPAQAEDQPGVGGYRLRRTLQMLRRLGRLNRHH